MSDQKTAAPPPLQVPTSGATQIGAAGPPAAAMTSALRAGVNQRSPLVHDVGRSGVTGTKGYAEYLRAREIKEAQSGTGQSKIALHFLGHSATRPVKKSRHRQCWGGFLQERLNYAAAAPVFLAGNFSLIRADFPLRSRR